MRINTNISSLGAQEAATATNNQLRGSLEKLSSGLRINKASDDASGLSIADKLRTQASSIKQSIANANSGVTLVQIVKHHIRQDDKLIRWGGEEFIVIAPVNSINELYRIAEHLRVSIAEYEFKNIKHLTCSFGIEIYDYKNILKTIKKSDEKLYKAKESGRNRVIK